MTPNIWPWRRRRRTLAQTGRYVVSIHHAVPVAGPITQVLTHDEVRSINFTTVAGGAEAGDTDVTVTLAPQPHRVALLKILVPRRDRIHIERDGILLVDVSLRSIAYEGLTRVVKLTGDSRGPAARL